MRIRIVSYKKNHVDKEMKSMMNEEEIVNEESTFPVLYGPSSCLDFLRYLF